MQEFHYSYGSEPNAALGFCFIGIFAIIGLISLAFTILIYCKLSSKAGYHWAMGLLMFVPIANIIIMFMYVFGQWPIQRELAALKHAGMAPPPPGQPHESFRGI